MGNVRVYTLLLALIVFTSVVHASSFDAATIEDHLLDSGDLVESLTLTISQNTETEFMFELPPKATSINVNGKPTNQKENLSIPLQCSTCSIVISYGVPSVLKKEGSGIFSFSRTISFPQTPATLEYRLLLPIGYAVDDFSSVDPAIVPTPTKITSDGEHIVIVWSGDNVALPQRFFVRVSDHENTENTGQEIGNEFKEWPVWVIGISLLIVGFVLGIAIAKRKRNDNVQREVPASLLSSDERTILKTLKGSEKPLTQKEVGKNLGWSKSKVSALMTALERKEIITREKIGRNFKIEVIKEIEPDR
jgi:hypothetical protein